MKVKTSVKLKLQVRRAKSDLIVHETAWMKNLVLDQGLDGFARGGANSGPPNGASQRLLVGDGTAPTKIASGAITFTQSGTTLTASGGFFTADMVGGLFKWGTGTGGTEVYISAFTDSTHVELQDSAEVASPEIGTVWQVQQTELESLLYSTNTFQTNTGDNETTIVGNVVSHKRTFIITQKGSQYTVNEIGWRNASALTTVGGRIVLPSSVVVGTDNYLVVILVLNLTYSPGTPTAVVNVGTNIDTAGNAMVEWAGLDGIVSSTGGTTNPVQNATSSGILQLIVADYTQLSNLTGLTQDASPTVSSLNGSNESWVNDPTEVGKMIMTHDNGISCNGQTLYGLGLRAGSGQNKPIFDLKLTTPFELPVGTWLADTIFAMRYGRTLEN